MDKHLSATNEGAQTPAPKDTEIGPHCRDVGLDKSVVDTFLEGGGGEGVGEFWRSGKPLELCKNGLAMELWAYLKREPPDTLAVPLRHRSRLAGEILSKCFSLGEDGGPVGVVLMDATLLNRLERALYDYKKLNKVRRVTFLEKVFTFFRPVAGGTAEKVPETRAQRVQNRKRQTELATSICRPVEVDTAKKVAGTEALQLESTKGQADSDSSARRPVVADTAENLSDTKELQAESDSSARRPEGTNTAENLSDTKERQAESNSSARRPVVASTSENLLDTKDLQAESVSSPRRHVVADTAENLSDTRELQAKSYTSAQRPVVANASGNLTDAKALQAESDTPARRPVAATEAENLPVMKALRLENRRLQAKLNASAKKIAKFNAQLAENSRVISEKEEQRQIALGVAMERQQQINKLQAVVDELTRHNASQKSKLGEVRRELKSTQRAVSRGLKSLAANRARSRQQVTQLRERRRKLQEKLHRRERALRAYSKRGQLRGQKQLERLRIRQAQRAKESLGAGRTSGGDQSCRIKVEICEQIPTNMCFTVMRMRDLTGCNPDIDNDAL